MAGVSPDPEVWFHNPMITHSFVIPRENTPFFLKHTCIGY
uniref:Uncharacterized protein n=1 Tax=Arundo donax TaxID=35708 RepID=A0A0A9BAS9_ARUDO